MTMMAFHTLFPDVAGDECRSITPLHGDRLPSRTLLLVEAYCVEPRCDCRRVMINVIDTASHAQVATINYGFEEPKPPHDDLGQMFLDPLNPQSAAAGALLDLFAEMVDRDPEYHDRLVRYYTMWKRVVDDPSHPDHGKIRSAEPGDGILRRAPPRRRSEPRVGANAPCPCGSGRKFKKCLRDRPADRHGDLRV